MEKKVEKLEVFYADDGKRFTDEEKCKEYEEKILKAKDKIKCFSSYTKPDLTEGRGYYKCIYIAVLDYNGLHMQRALLYMGYKYGEMITKCYQTPTENWTIPKSMSKEHYLHTNPTSRVGDYVHDGEKVFIAPKDLGIEEYPKPLWVNHYKGIQELK